MSNKNKEILSHEWDSKDEAELAKRLQKELAEAEIGTIEAETEEKRKEVEAERKSKLQEIADRLNFDSVDAMLAFEKSIGAKEKPDYPQTRYGFEFVTSVDEVIPLSPEELKNWLENLEFQKGEGTVEDFIEDKSFDANLGEKAADYLEANQENELVAKKLKELHDQGVYYLIFPGTERRLPDGSRFVLCLRWLGGRWHLGFGWLGGGFGLGDHVVRLSK